MMRKSEATRGVLKDPFDAIPIIPESVEIREDREGNVQLRVPQDLGRMREKVADWLGQDHSSKVALDEHGSFFIRQIDGERDLKMIVDAMVEHSGRARKDVEEGVVLYTKKLMTKNMLALKIVK
jgi:hypothetical protein